MTARQTIVRVRDHNQTRLAAEVAAVLPGLAAVARSRLSGSLTRPPYIRTTFCPVCGGSKSLRASRCHWCLARVLHEGKVAAGGRSSGRAAGARALTQDDVSRNNPDPGYGPVGAFRKVHGAGQARPTPTWRRRLLVNGRWVLADAE